MMLRIISVAHTTCTNKIRTVLFQIRHVLVIVAFGFGTESGATNGFLSSQPQHEVNADEREKDVG